MPSPEISIDNFKVSELDFAFALGTNDRLITIDAQQVRAATLAVLLNEKFEKKGKVLIVGGGIAGLTLARELLERKWVGLSIVERLPDLLAIQNACDTRYVHPNLINWPKSGSHSNHLSTIKSLQWTAGSAANATYEIEKKWNDYIEDITGKKNTKPSKLIEVNLGVTYLRIALKDRTNAKADWIRDSSTVPIPIKGHTPKNSAVAEYDYVVFANGFGIEGRLGSYWRNDDLGQIHIDGRQRQYIISGMGDGAISDLLRLRTKSFTIDRFFSEFPIVGEDEKIFQEIALDITEGGSPFDFFQGSTATNKRKDFWKKLFGYFRDRRRDDTKVRIQHHKGVGFLAAFDASPASFLSKLLLYVMYRNGEFTFVEGDLDSVAADDEIKIIRQGVKRDSLIKAVCDLDAIVVPNQRIDACLKALLRAKNVI
jgi:hypothetical protein